MESASAGRWEKLFTAGREGRLGLVRCPVGPWEIFFLWQRAPPFNTIATPRNCGLLRLCSAKVAGMRTIDAELVRFQIPIACLPFGMSGDTENERPKSPIPEDVQRFIIEYIDSVPALEALLLMRRIRDREWTVSMLAHDLFVEPQRVAVVMSDLVGRGLCGMRKAEEPLYFWGPATVAIAERLEHLAAAYATHLIAVTQVIHEKPRPSVRGFSDAFRFRGRE